MQVIVGAVEFGAVAGGIDVVGIAEHQTVQHPAELPVGREHPQVRTLEAAAHIQVSPVVDAHARDACESRGAAGGRVVHQPRIPARVDAAPLAEGLREHGPRIEAAVILTFRSGPFSPTSSRSFAAS